MTDSLYVEPITALIALAESLNRIFNLAKTPDKSIPGAEKDVGTGGVDRAPAVAGRLTISFIRPEAA
jgi:hypothetical protein